MKIYTRGGDAGETRLLAGMTARKSDARVAFCGELDELNAMIGVVLASGPEPALSERLRTVQEQLLEVGAWAASVGSAGNSGIRRSRIPAATRVETWIDEIDEQLPALGRFILPGGGQAAALMHLARAVCRRSERALVLMLEQHPDTEGAAPVLAWLNRLGDWMFVAARWLNAAAGIAETEWTSDAGPDGR